MNERKITVFSTNGTYIEIKTAATVWSELKPLVQEHYALDNLNPTESVGKTSFTHPNAKLPAGDFVLYLRPVKTKSGLGIDALNHMSHRDLAFYAKRSVQLEEAIKKANGGKSLAELPAETIRQEIIAFEARYGDIEFNAQKQDYFIQEALKFYVLLIQAFTNFEKFVRLHFSKELENAKTETPLNCTAPDVKQAYDLPEDVKTVVSELEKGFNAQTDPDDEDDEEGDGEDHESDYDEDDVRNESNEDDEDDDEDSEVEEEGFDAPEDPKLAALQKGYEELEKDSV